MLVQMRRDEQRRLSAPSVAPRLPPWWLGTRWLGRATGACGRAIGRRDCRRRDRRRRLHGSLDGSRAAASGSPICGSRCSRRRSAGTGRAAVTAASCTATGPRSPGILPVLGRGAGAPARTGRRSGSSPGSVRCGEARGEDVWLRRGGDAEARPRRRRTLGRDGGGRRRDGGRAGAERSRSRRTKSRRADSSPVFRSGVYLPRRRDRSSGLLVRALRRAALDAGVTIHEQTPVTAVRACSPNELGRRAEPCARPRSSLATNAALTGWRPASRNLTNFGSYVVLTEPCS